MSHYIDVDALLTSLPDDLPYKASVKRVLMQAPTVDVVEVVTCDNCHFCAEVDGVFGKALYCTEWCKDVDADTYCSHGLKLNKEATDV